MGCRSPSSVGPPVNALTKKVEEWNSKAEVVFSLEQGHGHWSGWWHHR